MAETMAGNTKRGVYGGRPRKVEPAASLGRRARPAPTASANMERVTEQTQQTRPLADRIPEEIEAFLDEQQAPTTTSRNAASSWT